MDRMGKIWIVAVAALVMSGCAAGVAQSAPVEATSAAVESAAPTVEPSAMPTPEAPAEPVPAPITMEPVAPDERTEAQKAGFVDENDWFLTAVKSDWNGEMPTDAELLGAAALACEGLGAGLDPATITVVQGEGDAAMYNNRDVVDAARYALCPI